MTGTNKFIEFFNWVDDQPVWFAAVIGTILFLVMAMVGALLIASIVAGLVMLFFTIGGGGTMMLLILLVVYVSIYSSISKQRKDMK